MWNSPGDMVEEIRESPSDLPGSPGTHKGKTPTCGFVPIPSCPIPWAHLVPARKGQWLVPAPLHILPLPGDVKVFCLFPTAARPRTVLTATSDAMVILTGQGSLDHCKAVTRLAGKMPSLCWLCRESDLLPDQLIRVRKEKQLVSSPRSVFQRAVPLTPSVCPLSSPHRHEAPIRPTQRDPQPPSQLEGQATPPNLKANSETQ